MSSIKILHCADAHIGARETFLGAKSKERQAEALITFEKSVNLAVKEDVKVFLIAGDLFDSNKVELSLFRRVLSIIGSNKGIRFVYAAGNHDPFNTSSPFKSLSLPDNLYIFDTKDSYFTFDDIKVRVYGRSFRDVYEKSESAFSIIPPEDDYINIMCIHGDYDAPSSSYNYIRSEFIEKSQMDYIALGHVHKRSEPTLLGGTYFAYSGCMEGQGFDEPGEKGVYVGFVSKSGLDFRFVPLSMRLHIREDVDVSGVTSSADAAIKVTYLLKEKYGEGYTSNLYRITLVGSVSEDADLSSREVSVRLNESVYFAKVKDKTTPDVNFEILSKEPTLKGLFVKKMLEKINSADDTQKALYEKALSLGLKAFSTEVKYLEDQ
ncbi:MAG: metallophosphoesterase [Clostridia bacterium]|nr:metallophosphoesterase [Clostridia bacterium]